MTTRGYTLIESLFALLLAALLAQLAWSGYEASVRRTHRTLAQARLVEAALWMEQHRSIHQRYADAGGGAPELPAHLQQVMVQGRLRYAIHVELPQPQGYRLVAMPQAWRDADCGALTLDHLGQRGATGQQTATRCWGQ